MIRLARYMVMALMLARTAAAADSTWVSTNRYDLPAGHSIPGQLFVMADESFLDGVVQDDLFLVSRGQANINGENQGDTWVLAGQTQLGGHMLDHVRVIGQSVIVRGDLERSLYALGSAVLMSTGSVVREHVFVAGENVTIEGTVGGQVNIVAQSVTLAGHIAGSVNLMAQDIVVMPGAYIAGDLSYTSPKELFLDNPAQLGGTLRRIQPSGGTDATSSYSLASLLMMLGQCMAALLVGLPFAALFPRVMGRATRLVRFSLLRCLIAGFSALFLIPLLAVGAALTMVGLPLGLLAAGLAGSLLYLGKTVVALVLGGLLLRRRGAQSFSVATSAMAIGLILLYASFALPVIGGSISMAVAVVGSGALWWSMLRGEGRHEAEAMDGATGSEKTRT